MNKIVYKSSNIVTIICSLIILMYCENKINDIPFLPDANDVNINTWNIYYLNYSVDNDVNEEIVKVEKVMKGWNKINLSGCDFKFLLFQKMSNKKISQYIMYNMSWKKDKYISIIHFEKEMCNSVKRKIDVFFMINENFNSESAFQNGFPHEIEYRDKDLIKDLKLLKCYAKNIRLEENNGVVSEFIEWGDKIDCPVEISSKDIEKILIKKAGFGDYYNLLIYINKEKMLIPKDEEDFSFLFLLNKNHIISFSKMKYVNIEDNMIGFNNNSKNILTTIGSHLLYSYACCHELEIPAQETRRIYINNKK
ncbi:MAG: hypothetical protein A2Y62_18795 [Candidatus Fischerbacteria bacterium RBG_13_37_8]|uniref:Uncharacterized protein n=1 Tax=Candidatus Fischerbacteria bacterium RBG_13_37_8 TaxID=1817863 RepID=A0A1F5VT34_9BACT|nr:MAG: hypothetical protein A2Y62_18795 [Candidatus Fischerbacteria bacterium RBG_13_37_8]